MNLVSQMEQEMNEFMIDQPFDIARYLYLRTGQLFEYHPFYSYMDKRMQESINQERKDIFSIHDFYVTCFSWSSLYVDLLTYFGISAEKVFMKNHCFVLVSINDMVIQADLMAKFFDFYRTKVGLNTRDYVSKMKDFKLQLWDFDHRIQSYPIRMETVFSMIRKEIASDSHNEEELLFHSFEAVSSFMDYYSFGSITGKNFLYHTMNYFSDNLYFEYGGMGTFYDIYNQQRIDIFSYYVPSDVTKQELYRFDSKESGGLKLVRTNQKEIELYFRSMNTDQEDYFKSILY